MNDTAKNARLTKRAIEIEEQIVEYAKKRTLEELHAALDVMISFVNDAKHDLTTRSDRELHRAISDVVHKLAWGNANASSHIENAISYNAEMIAATAAANSMKEKK